MNDEYCCEGCGRGVYEYPRPQSGFCRACEAVDAMFDDEPIAAQAELEIRLKVLRTRTVR